MLTLPSEGSAIILQFRSLFSKKTFALLHTLLSGVILATGSRTICAILRFCGLATDKNFHKYHRFLSRAKWSGLKTAKTLFDLIVNCFCPGSGPLILGIDETIERRRGPKIKAKGIYRDPVRSSQSHFVKCSGLRWICLMLLAPIPWAARIWALPFFCALAPSERYCKEHKKKHKKIRDWARQMILLISRWFKDRPLIVVADSAYATIELLVSVQSKATMITRLRLDAALYDPAPHKPQGSRGRHRVKGSRQPSLAQRLEQDHGQGLEWVKAIVPQWYGKKDVKVELASGTAIWYHGGIPALPIRWVLLRDVEGKGAPAALLSTDVDMDPLEIVNCFIRRWTVEVTLREVRTHLGVETQRQWSDKAIERATPCLLGLYSIVTLWADSLFKNGVIELEQTSWYKKKLPTFSDAMAQVRTQVWKTNFFYTSASKSQTIKISASWLNFLIDRIARSA